MRFKSLLSLSLLFTFVSSCKEFIEPSIEKSIIRTLAPAENFQSEKYTVSLWWETLDDALHYRLQIVHPTFDSPDNLVVDSIIKSDKFSITLEPGLYQWRVRAENGSTHTAFTVARRITIVPSSLALQKMQLLSPSDDKLTNESMMLFKWRSLYGATNYRIQVDTNGFNNEADLIIDRITPALQWNFTVTKNKIYQWRVKAMNSLEESPWSAIYAVNFDNIPPEAPKLSWPENNAQLQQSVSFKWQSVKDGTKYKLYLFKGNNNNATLYKNFPVEISSTNYDFTAENIGEQFSWRVTSLDAAGNESIPSEPRNFRIQ